MNDRPFFRATIEQLELLFSETKDLESLTKIRAELLFRSTQRAVGLLRKVEDTIRLQNSKTEPGGRTPHPKDNNFPITSNSSAHESDQTHRTSETSNAQPSSAKTFPNRKENAAPEENDRSPLGFEALTASSRKPTTNNHAKLLDLLAYLEHLAKLGEKAIFALREYQQLVFTEADLKGQIGITHDVSSDEGQVWLRIERLLRADPPTPPHEIRDWVVLSRDPTQPPKIEDVLTRTVTTSEADNFVSTGRARSDERSPSLKLRDGERMVDVILRLDAQPSVKSAISSYMSVQWTPWAENEKLRRATIAIYDKFFGLYQSLQTEGVERPLEIVWGVGVARWKLHSQEIDHPLIEQLVEIEVDTESGVITIGPRSATPQLALKPYFSLEIDGVDATLSFANHFFESMPVDLEFSPFQRNTFEPVLRFAATHLDSAGRYHPDDLKDINDRTLPPIAESLVITDTWAIYARPRSANFLIEDLNRLRKAVTNSPELPGPSKKLVETPSSETTYSPTLIDITKATLGGPQSDSVSGKIDQAPTESEQEFFFPKPFNADQVAIVQRLEETDGVVVQGPPGTGKTHTIANIICHCLATGRKVLVTSKGEAALGVLRKHIPEGIRDLTISLLTNEREGLKQLERAVALLANTATQINPATLEKQILSGQQQIIDLKRRLSSIDAELASFAKKHLARVPHETNSDGLLPIELAQLLATDADRHSWLSDSLSLDPRYNPLFNDEDISSLRQTRRLLGKDLCYATANVPALADLPDGAQIMILHQDLLNCELIERQMQTAHFSRLRLTAPDSAEKCKVLAESIKQVILLWDTVDELGWLKPFAKRWLQGELETEKEKLFESLSVGIGDIRKKRTEMLAYAISCPDEIVGDSELVEAVHRAANGERPFGFMPFGRAQARERFSSIRIEGRIPNSMEDWYKVERYFTWRSKVSSTIARWNAIAAEYGLPHLKDQGDSTARWLSETLDKVDRAKCAARQHAALIKQGLPDLFPHGLDIELVISSRDHASKAIESIEANLSAIRYGTSRNLLNSHVHKLKDSSGPIVEKVRKFMTQDVGNPDIPAEQVSDQWQQLCREIDRVHNLKSHFETVNRVAVLIKQSGALRWADFVLQEEVGVGVEDKWTPSYWSESWSWVRFRSYLKEIDGRDRFRQLSILRRRHEGEIQQAFSEVVRLRTYLGLKQNISNQVEAALNMFMAALRHIGKGTGIRARRFRQDARNAMENSYAAVPCWIMPTWRISESLPASLGSFDVVIIDEASQSDITALPALLRGKKVLVVGDDKQVSPTAAFVEEKKLLQLRHNYLKEQPFGPLMLPGFSLYELALAAFPGKRIMLREHFRCVEPIIRFSFQFYEEPIVPVRIAKPSERLTPPLIDVYVPHGQKDKRQINLAEAEAIVDEIEKIVKDPAFAKRTIGVVSLLAAKQAYYIQTCLLERIGEEEYLRHQITCGDSATFQGKERDIMFVSMVECPATRSTKTALLFQQRFNVALSRARDRMYLFRSVTENMLKPEDLKARVLQHFKRPMPAMNEASKTLLEQCDSDFEREVLKRLLDLGYRVTPQVRVGPFSIDMVVEGEADRRLAIELDGDKYHTPERWADDLSRQRVMERVGWRFWRCWGSSFLLDPEGCFADLIATLKELEIRPSASDTGPSSYTEFRIIEATSKTEPKTASILAEETFVEVGDRVVVTFNDEPGRQHTIVISADRTDESMGIYSTEHTLGKALLGAMVEDEIPIVLGDKTRSATILGIAKPAEAN
ncbi:MAG TPA: AAA domain-containing protein [Candidatus Acidoferrales bacterium]|nr:AAA domain-containing protein [Candidatus Acidoferrales bacterium]